MVFSSGLGRCAESDIDFFLFGTEGANFFLLENESDKVLSKP